MGKKQVRMQMRKIKPKVAASAPPGQGATRRQRERYVQAGGMLAHLPLESDHRAEDDGEDEADGLLVIQVDEVVHALDLSE